MTYVLKINGQVADETNRRKFAARHGGLQEMLESRRPPGGHECYWGQGHTSTSAAVHAKDAKSHADWIRSQGLTGVRVNTDGSITTESPRERERYLTARGLADTSSHGAGEFSGQFENERRRSKSQSKAKENRKKIREQARKLAHDPQIRAIAGR